MFINLFLFTQKERNNLVNYFDIRENIFVKYNYDKNNIINEE